LPAAITAVAAKQRTREILSAALAGGFDPKAGPPRKLGAAFDEYARWCDANRPNVAKKRRAITKRLLASLGDNPLAEITALDVERFKRDRRAAGRLGRKKQSGAGPVLPCASATVNRELEVLRHFFGLAVAWGWVPHEHARTVRAVRKLKEPPGRVRYLAPEEEGRLLGALPVQVRRIVTAGLLSGMRQAEIVKLRREHLDLDSGTITLPTSKANKARRVFVNAALADVLREALADGASVGSPFVFVNRKKKPYTTDGVRTIFRRAVGKVGLVNFRFHDLRHTTATRLRQRGVGLDVVADVLGHATLQMARRYTHVGVSTMRDAMASLPTPAAPVAPEPTVMERARDAGVVEHASAVSDGA
jgi:integrase